MTTRNWLFFVALIFAVTQEINSACVCNEKGTDACSKDCTELSGVKPKQKHSEKSNIPLPPVGDSCWCKSTLIEPAALPKPCTDQQKPPSNCKCKTSKTYANTPSMPPPSSYSTYSMPKSYNVPAAPPKDDSPPADPISISLAIQAGKAIEVPEAKLAYGFVQKPIDDQPKVYHSSVKEENLYALKKEVITWKKPNVAYKQPEEEEYYPEPEDEEIESYADEEETPSLTYKQLGYEAEQYKNPQFQQVVPVYSSSYAPSKPAIVPGKVSTDCGYRPGRIVKYKQNKKQCVGECLQRY